MEKPGGVIAQLYLLPLQATGVEGFGLASLPSPLSSVRPTNLLKLLDLHAFIGFIISLDKISDTIIQIRILDSTCESPVTIPKESPIHSNPTNLHHLQVSAFSGK